MFSAEIFCDIGHTAGQMIQIMAMVKPGAGVVGDKLNGASAHMGRNDQGIFLQPYTRTLAAAGNFKKSLDGFFLLYRVRQDGLEDNIDARTSDD